MMRNGPPGRDWKSTASAVRAALIVLACTIFGTAAVLFPVLLVAAIILGIGCWVIGRTLQKPILGYVSAMYIVPWPSFIRALGGVYAPSVPLFVVRFWLEIVISVIIASIVLRKLIYPKLPSASMRWTWEDMSIHLLMLAGIYGLILTLAQGNYSAAMFGIDISITPLISYYLLRALRIDRAQSNQILTAFAIGYVLVAVPSLYDYFVHPRFLFEVGLHARGVFNVDVEKMRIWYQTVFFRMQSLMYHEDFWGAISGLVSTYSLVRLFGGRAPRYLYFLAALSTVGLILSMARGATLGWVVGMFVVLLTYKGKRIRFAASMLVVGLLLGAVYMQYRSDARIQFIEGRAEAMAPVQSETEGSRVVAKQNTFDGRTMQWAHAFEAILNQPSGFGLGTDGFAAEFNNNAPRLVSDGGYLRVGVEQGMFGFVLVMAGMVCIPITVWRRLRSIQDDPLAQALGVCLIAQTASTFVQAIAGNAFDYPYTSNLYFILFAIFMELTTARNQTAKARFAPDDRLTGRALSPMQSLGSSS